MSEEDLLYEFQTLHNVNRRYGEEIHAVGTFGYRGDKLVVTWEPEAFTVIGSANMEMEEIARAFERYFPLPEMYVSEDGDDFEKVFQNHYQYGWEVEAIKGKTGSFGFGVQDDGASHFPDGENVFWVFSDADRFDYSAESVRGIEDVFPEILGTRRDEEVLFEEATDFAMMDHERLVQGEGSSTSTR